MPRPPPFPHRPGKVLTDSEKFPACGGPNPQLRGISRMGLVLSNIAHPAGTTKASALGKATSVRVVSESLHDNNHGSKSLPCGLFAGLLKRDNKGR